MDSSILQVTSPLDINAFQFAQSASVTASGAMMVPFNYNDHPLYFQTPVIVCPIGFKLFEKAHTITHKLMVNPNTETMEFVQNIDNIVIDKIMENAQAWFGKTFGSREIIQALFYPSLRTNAKYPPSMSVRLRFNNETGLPMFTVFDVSRNEIVFSNTDGPARLVDLLKGKCQLRLILGNASIWGVSGRYGYGWDCIQLQICVNYSLCNVRTCLFLDDEEESKDVV